MDSEPSIWINLIAAVLFFATLLGLGFFLHERQRKILEGLAKKYDLHMSEGGSRQIFFPSERAIKRKGVFLKYRPEVRWSLKGKVGDVEISLYKMCLRSGSSSDPKSRTWGYPYLIGRFVHEGLDLPKTLIRPRSVIGKLRRWMIRNIDTPLERFGLDRNFEIITDSEEEFFEKFGDETLRLFDQNKSLTGEFLANAFYLFDKPSHLRFMMMTEPSLERLLHQGVRLAQALQPCDD